MGWRNGFVPYSVGSDLILGRYSTCQTVERLIQAPGLGRMANLQTTVWPPMSASLF